MLRNARPAGRSTETLGAAGAYYAPLLAPNGCLGVVGLRFRGRVVTLQCERTMPLVWTDFVLMEQVLVNILTNAMSHTPEGSPVDVTVFAEERWIGWCVMDRGRGVPSEDRERIFGKFQRLATSMPGGTGLGLSIVKGFLDAMGGMVDLAERRVTVHAKPVSLTATEYALLRLFVRHAGKALTHRYILREVWGPGSEEQTHYLRVYMARLREKLEPDPNASSLFVTESGVGYRLRVEVEPKT